MEYETNGGITEPAGFKAAGIKAGMKMGKKDMCMIFSEVPAATAGVFTLNQVAAAPVIIDKLQLSRNQYYSAIVVNSGVANACTGEQGMKDGWETISHASKVLNIDEKEILISSTGVIGKNLMMDKIKKGIEICSRNLSKDNHKDAAEAIMTTDTFPKEYSIRTNINGYEIAIGGMAKGSGMIKPNMATMLAYLTSNVNIKPSLLNEALHRAVNKSFNRISVDNDTSTNDTVIIMANGLSGVPVIDKFNESFEIFYIALEKVCITLAKMIVKDGEGAKKFIEVNIKGANSEEEAVKIARSIADSYLVKTAIHGEDANWGRIIAAAGYSGVTFKPEKILLKINDLVILEPEFKQVFSEKDAKETLSQNEIKIQLDLGQGSSEVSIWTCDLSKDYISINANYRS
jgi:glutamate N-acetyltransferase/amino-acid N-acetyltransferase